MDSSTEPAAEPCGGMWVGDPKAWPEWKTVHPQTALVRAVADQAEAAFGDHPLYSGDDFGDAEHHFNAIRAWMSERPNALFTPPELVVDAMMLTEGRNREEIVRCSSGRRLSSVPSVKADKPGMRGYLHAMGQMSGVITSLHDAFDWDRRQVLRISPKNPASATDVEMVLTMDGHSSIWPSISGVRRTLKRSSSMELRNPRCGAFWVVCRLLRPPRAMKR